MDDKTPDRLLLQMGIKSAYDLTDLEIEEVKEIDAWKQAYFLQSLALNEVAKQIAKREQVFFEGIYKRLNLDPYLGYQANWRTRQIRLPG